VSLYPPGDFHLTLEYRVERDSGVQVKRRVSIDSEGLVIVREADASFRSADGSQVLPIFRRICVYELHARSTRSLSRWLSQENVKELSLASDVKPQGVEIPVVEFGLVYSQNAVNAVARGPVRGPLRRVLRAINAFLPAPAALPNGDDLATRAESRVQDVPELQDSIADALSYHLQRQSDETGGLQWQRDCFALACAAGNWAAATETLAAMSLDASERVVYEQIQAATKAIGSGR
jgi:hypothetical protein